MTKALIIGGGIGGAAVAMALRKANIDPIVFEAYPHGAQEAGAFLTVMSNGMSGLRAIDAHEPVIAHSFPAKGVEYLSAKGKWVGARSYEAHSASAGLPRTITRGKLISQLYELLAARDIPVSYGKRLVTAKSRAEDVTAHFADGTSATGDVLIGADGIHSATRTAIDPSATVPRYIGQNILYGYTEKAASSPDARYHMMYGKHAFFGCITDPAGSTWWFARLPGSELSKSELCETPAADWRKRALDHFAEDRTSAASIIGAPGEIFAINAYDVPSVRLWSKDSMVLIGDAAHAASPSVGQGASMTIEDSVVLAKCLRDLPGPDEAFATYEQLRRPRVERVVEVSANQDPGTPRWRPIRRFLHDLKISRTSQGTHPHSWLHDYRVDWDTPVARS